MQPAHHRYRVTVIAHRRSPSRTAGGSAGGSAGEAAPWSAPWSASGIVHVQIVRATDPALARDLALVHVHAESALVADVRVGVDAVLVERLRWGRSPVRELDSRRAAVVR